MKRKKLKRQRHYRNHCIECNSLCTGLRCAVCSRERSTYDEHEPTEEELLECIAERLPTMPAERRDNGQGRKPKELVWDAQPHNGIKVLKARYRHNGSVEFV